MRENVSGSHVFTLLTRSTRSVREHVARYLATLPLCESDFAAMEALLHKGPLPVNEIGRKVLLESGSVTTAVDRLERRGLVVRRDAPSDRRVRLVHLTDAGRTLIERAFRQQAAVLDHAVGTLNEDERTVLIGLLRRLGHGAWERLATDPGPARPRPTASRSTGKRVPYKSNKEKS